MNIKFGRFIKSIVQQLINISASLTKKNKRMQNYYYIPIGQLQEDGTIPEELDSFEEILNDSGLKVIEDKQEIGIIKNRYSKLKLKTVSEETAFKSALDQFRYNRSNISDTVCRIEEQKLKENTINLYSRKQLDRGFIAVNNVPMFIETALKVSALSQIVQIFDWKKFEDFIGYVLSNFGYKTATNFRFSLDMKSYDGPRVVSRTTKKIQKRFEIDIIGVKKNIILFIDAKYWPRTTDITSALNSAAVYQSQRAHAFSRDKYAIEKLNKKTQIAVKSKRISTIKMPIGKMDTKSREKYIFPIIVYVGPACYKVADCGVPLVSLKSFSDFIQNFVVNSQSFVKYKLKRKSYQTKF